MNPNYENLIRIYFGRNRANQHLIRFGNDLAGLLHSAWIAWDVERTNTELEFIRNEIKRCVDLVSSKSFPLLRKQEILTRLESLLHLLNTGTVEQIKKYETETREAV